MEILRCSELADVPWKNGGGITREIAMAKQNDRMIWRLSRADVAQNGPFSEFVGLSRILTVVAGNGIVLQYPGGTLEALSGIPVAFDGGLSVVGRLLDGPLTDLNLMFDPARCEGQVVPLQGPSEHVTDRLCAACHVLAGKPHLDGQSLYIGDTAFPAKATRAVLETGDALLEIRIRYVDQSDDIRLSIAAR